jgi:cyclase
MQMNRQRPLVAGVLGAALAAVALAQGQPGRFENVDFTIVPVNGQVSMLQVPGGGGNIAVLTGPEGALLVDAQFAPLTDKLVAAVDRISRAGIRFLINTHVHIDHTGGNENLARQGVVIAAHENVRRRLMKELRIPRRGGQFFPQPAEDARPIVTYQDEMTFHLNGEEVRTFLVPPAHTDGDSFVYFRNADVLHTGDVFRTTSYPIVDVYNGGTLAGMIRATELAIELSGPGTKPRPRPPRHRPRGRPRSARDAGRHPESGDRAARRGKDAERGDGGAAHRTLRRQVGPGSDLDR